MTYYGAKDLAESFRTVRKNTIIIAEEIPEDRYSFRAAPETRTVAQTLYHVAAVPGVQNQIHAVERRTTLEGFDFPGYIRRLMAEEQEPRTKAQIVAIFLCEGRRTHSHSWQVDALVLFEQSTMHHLALNIRLVMTQHAQFHQAIVEQDAIPHLHILG